MTQGGYFGALSGRLRRPPPPAVGVKTADAGGETVRATYVLSDFLAGLKAHAAEPVVVDLGPAIGANVAFLGRSFACKLHIEDLLTKRTEASRGAAARPLRLPHSGASVDGILGWDVLDYLPRAEQSALAAEMVRVLRPAGLLLLYHRLEVARHPDRVEHEIVDPGRLRLRRNDAAPPRIGSLERSEIGLLFRDLTAVKTVLLRDRMREVLFRKSKPASGAD